VGVLNKRCHISPSSQSPQSLVHSTEHKSESREQERERGSEKAIESKSKTQVCNANATINPFSLPSRQN